jgi:hypothetical protein
MMEAKNSPAPVTAPIKVPQLTVTAKDRSPNAERVNGIEASR